MKPKPGRPRGSTKPLNRMLLAEEYAIEIELLLNDEGLGRNAAVQQVYVMAYACDHPGRSPFTDTGKLTDHFTRYRNTQKQLRKKGKLKSIAALKREEAKQRRR